MLGTTYFQWASLQMGRLLTNKRLAKIPLNASSVIRLKVPLQNRTVRGLMLNKEKARFMAVCVLDSDMVMMGMFYFWCKGSFVT